MAGKTMVGGGGVYLYVDATDFYNKVNFCRSILSKQNFTKLVNRTFNEVGRRARPPIAREVQKQYVVTQAWVKSQMGSPKTSTLRLEIPLKGARGSIGGIFPASGGNRHRKRVKAKIVRGGASTLPTHMTHQGGQPPFMVSGVCFTRKTAARFPIASVKGLAVPQMPLNRAAEGVQDRILEIAEERLWHNLSHMFG